MTSDAHIQEAVLAELRWEPQIDAAHIGVAVEGGVVTLSGRVETYAQKHAAEAAAHRVKGVLAVAEDIEVRPAVDDRQTDADIAAAALERLAWDSTVRGQKVELTVQDGWITLSGEVDWAYQRESAEQALHTLHGVTGISNLVAIRKTVDAGNISDEIMHALHRSWFFDPRTIAVSAEGGSVVLTGTARSPHERQLAAATAWAAPGVTDVRNEVVIV